MMKKTVLQITKKIKVPIKINQGMKNLKKLKIVMMNFLTVQKTKKDQRYLELKKVQMTMKKLNLEEQGPLLIFKLMKLMKVMKRKREKTK